MNDNAPLRCRNLHQSHSATVFIQSLIDQQMANRPLMRMQRHAIKNHAVIFTEPDAHT